MIVSNVTDTIIAVLGIIFVDLILSGDNALVIGSVAARVPQGRPRTLAFILGGLGAIVIRILCTTFAAFLLTISYLRVVGGVLVLIIAVRLLLDDPSPAEGESSIQQGEAISAGAELPARLRLFLRWLVPRRLQKISSGSWRLIEAIMTITIADISMSLDNIVAVGAIAQKQTVILIAGLLLSILLLLLSSALVSTVINRVPQIIILASIILAFVAADLVWNDIYKQPFVGNNPVYYYATYTISVGVVLLFVCVTRLPRFLAHRSERERVDDEEPSKQVS